MQDATDNPKLTADDIETAPNAVPATASDTQVSIDDLRTALAQVGEERDEFAAKLARTEQRVRTIEILDSLIKPYATRTFIFMCAYCATVGVLLTLDGFGTCGFDLPDSVLQFLVGSTATTVIGLVGMVLTGIFVGARRNHD